MPSGLWRGTAAGRSGPENARIIDTTEAWNAAGFPQEDYVVPGVIGVYSDPDTREARQERIRRMPIYYQNEPTGVFIAADPANAAPFVDRMLSVR